MPDESSLRDRLLERFNAAFAKCLLALWPDENKAWGMAFAAESVAIDSPQKQFRWLVGGIPVLLRESCKSFLGSLGRPASALPACSGAARRRRAARHGRPELCSLFSWYSLLRYFRGRRPEPSFVLCQRLTPNVGGIRRIGPRCDAFSRSPGKICPRKTMTRS
jgi:hypothetical protein